MNIKILFNLFLFLFCILNVYSNNNNIYFDQIDEIINLDEVSYLDFDFKKDGNLLDSSKNVSYIPELYENYYDLKGRLITILQYEIGVPGNHTDFQNRLYYGEDEYDLDDHATHVAGILIGAGILNNFLTGVAPSSELIAYQRDCSLFGCSYDFKEDFIEGINDYQVSVITNSWGNLACDDTGEYDLRSEDIDELIFGNSVIKMVPIVWAAGNERSCNSSTGFSTITPEASSKNGISVGNVYDVGYLNFHSSLGPTDDGRIKPDLVAPGTYINSTISDDFIDSYNNSNYSQEISDGIDDYNSSYIEKSGTSMAAPHVSGTIALMLEQWNWLYSYNPLPSTIKALLLDSTIDLSTTGNGTQIIDGPDYKNGYGLLNAKGAVDRIINETFIEANISDENNIYSINIQNQNELKVTLAWDDLPGSPSLSSEGVLVNDLDLKLISPSGKIFYPWTLDPENPENKAVRTKEDHLNNVEQIYINQSEIEEGEWLIQISLSNLDTSVDYQKYSLVSENKINPSRVKLISTPIFLQNYTYINNGLYEVILNTNQSVDISLGDYSYFTNESEAERKVFVIKQTGNNLPLRYTSEVEQ